LKFHSPFRRRPVDVVAAVNVFSERRTELLAELAAEQRMLEARLQAVIFAQAALLTGQQLVSAPEPEPEPARSTVGDAPWFDQGDEAESEPQSASVFSPEAIAEVRGDAEAAPPAKPETLPFAEHFAEREAGNGGEAQSDADRVAADTRRAEFIQRLIENQTQVPA
jgi:hypothetical protein